MENTGKIRILQNNIVQWSNMQNDLFERCMEGLITKEEYKARSNKLYEYINETKKEIHELSL